MKKISFSNMMYEINIYKSNIELYKKRFWLKKDRLDESQAKKIQRLFNKVDSLRNGLLLHVKQLAKKSHINYNEKPMFIEKSKMKIRHYFQQLDKMFLSIEERY